MRPMSDEPENMTRVLLLGKNGITLSFHFYKDGMFQEDNSSNWNLPSEFKSWVSIKELKSIIL